MLEALPLELLCFILVLLSPEDLLQVLSVSEHARRATINTLSVPNVRAAIALIAIKRCTSLWDRVDLIRKAIRAKMNVAVYESSTLCKPDENLAMTVCKPLCAHSVDYVFNVNCYHNHFEADKVWNPALLRYEPKEIRDPITCIHLWGFGIPWHNGERPKTIIPGLRKSRPPSPPHPQRYGHYKEQIRFKDVDRMLKIWIEI
jgi:hypothetical protein